MIPSHQGEGSCKSLPLTIRNPQSAEDYPAEALAKKVAAVQEQARKEGFVSDGKDDKLLMDEMWGEENGSHPTGGFL